MHGEAVHLPGGSVGVETHFKTADPAKETQVRHAVESPGLAVVLGLVPQPRFVLGNVHGEFAAADRAEGVDRLLPVPFSKGLEVVQRL